MTVSSYLYYKFKSPLKQLYYQHFITDEKLLKKKFKKRLGRDLDLINPIMFNDKLQWLKLNWENSKAKSCADKYQVRNYVSETIGNQYLNELIGVYDDINEINFELLPSKFVLKGTHGSGFNIVCTDKSKLNWNQCLKEMKRWLNTNYYLANREWVYKDIKPRIICERFIEQEDSKELRDYRFFCFNGVPKFIAIDFSINNKKEARRNLYNLNWDLMDEEISYPKEKVFRVPKPTKLNEMLKLSEKLSQGFPHSRVDFYYINNKIIFGEITFFHQSGMGKITPIEFEKQMGEWLILPK